MSARRPNVAFVRHCYFAPYELKVKREADALQAAGFQSRVICLRNEGESARDTVDGVEIYRLPIRHRRGKIARYLFEYNAFFFLASLVLFWLHARYRLRAVQVHTMPDYLVFCALFPKMTGAKVMLHIHEPMPELFGAIFKRWYTRFFTGAVTVAQRASIAFADRATTVTREMKETFGRHGSKTDKVTVVLNVPDDRLMRLDRYEHLRARVEARKAKEREQGIFRVFTHGAIEERYGNDTIVRAIARLQSEIPGIEFRFLGKGDAIDDVLALAGELGVADRVHYLGFVPLEDMIEEILLADVCVIAMKKNPYSVLVHTNKMFEYIAMGRPVIAARLDSTVSYFPDDCFVYFEPDDDENLASKIRFVHDHPEQMKIRTAVAAARYDAYRWEREKTKYLGVYSGLFAADAKLRVETRRPPVRDIASDAERESTVSVATPAA